MGQDKGSMNLHAKPMITHVIETLIHVSDEIVLVLRDENQADGYKKFLKNLKLSENIDFKICTDILKDHGPLAGILTGFQFINRNKVMVLPCDSPLVSELFVKKMFKLSKDVNFDAFVPMWSDGKLEPLHSIYKKNSMPIIQKLLEENILDIKSFITKLNVKFINAESLDPTCRSFFNINQRKDIYKL